MIEKTIAVKYTITLMPAVITIWKKNNKNKLFLEIQLNENLEENKIN